MKKLFAAILAITMILSSAVICVSAETTGSWADYATTAWYDGADANATTYTIETAADLAGLAVLVEEGNTFAGKTINVDDSVETIDLGDHYWLPIGRDATDKCFSGSFNGNGVAITNMTVDNSKVNNNSGAEQGLFGMVRTDSADNNITIGNFSLTGSLTSTVAKNGFVVGCIYTGVAATITIENISVDGTVSISTTQGSGGILGYSQINNASATLKFKNIINNVSVADSSSPKYAGGMIAQTHSSTNKGTINIENTVVKGNVRSGSGVAGGMIGWANGTGPVNYTNCLVLGNVVSTSSDEGSFVAYIGSAKTTHTITNCVTYNNNTIALPVLASIYTDGKPADRVVATNNYYVGAAANGDFYTAISADQINVFSNILTTASTLNGYANVAKTMTALTAACNAVAKTSGLCALQISTQEAGNPYSVRFIAKLDTTDYVRAGIKVSINGVEQTMDTTKVYTEISAYTKNGTIASYTAQQLGATYLYAAGVYNIPANAENVVITVTPYTVAMVEETETTVEGEAYEITFNKGVYVGAEKVEKAA